MGEVEIIKSRRASIGLKSFKCGASATALLASGLFALPAMAQPADTQSESTAEDRSDNVIVVTASRRAESVQDVSSSVSAFGAEQLKEIGANELANVSDAIPGAEIFDDRGAGQPTWVIRGVGLSDFNANNTPTAAIYYDENYLVSNVMGGIGLFDLERVEVLKGPQGGLYGRNTTGGALRIISAKSELDEFSGYVSASYGSWDQFGAQAAINVPLAEDKVAFRLSASLDQGGGWQDSLATPEDDNHGDRDFFAIRGQLRFALSPDVEALFKVDYGQDKSETTLGRATGAYDQVGNFCAPIIAGNRDDQNCFALSNLLGDPRLPSDQDDTGRRVLSNPINFLDNEWIGVNIQFDADLGFADLKTVSTYLKYDYRQSFDFDATPLVLGQTAAGDLATTEIEQWLQEIRLVSNDEGPFSWILGGLYATDTIEESGGSFAITDNFVVQAGFAPLFPPGFPLAQGFSSSYTQKTKSWAVYAEADYDLTDTVNINGSFRYTDERKRFENYSSVVNFDGFDVPLIAGLNQRTRLGSRVSGHFGIDWKPVDDVLVYAKYSRGFKSGGFYGSIAADPRELNPYVAETVNAYEFGVKSQPIDDLILNGAVFYYDYRDAQGFIQVANQALGSVTQLGTLGDARHIGVEAEFSWTPAALKGFSLQGSATYLDAEITDSNFLNLTQDGQLLPLQGLDRNFSPKFSFFVMARQEVFLTDSIIGAAQVSYSYRDALRGRGNFASTVDFGLLGFEGYGILNGRVSIAEENGQWELAVVGENLTNKVYIASATGDDLGSYLDIPTRPRRFRVEASFKF